jgi:hypothetical protein
MRSPFVALLILGLAACKGEGDEPARDDGSVDAAVDGASDGADATVESDSASDSGIDVIEDDVWPADAAGLSVKEYEIRLDPAAPAGKAVRVIPIFVPAPDAGDGGPAMKSENLSSLSHLEGTGAYDPATKTFTATLRLANVGARGWDEPRVYVTSFVTTGATSLTCAAAAGQSGTVIGTGGPGSSWAFSDITGASGSKHDAWQKIAIVDSDGMPATVRVEIRGFLSDAALSVDRDDDSWNVEVGEPAGGDCDDGDKAKFPGGATCTCLAACAGAPSAPACGAGQCCNDACVGPGCVRSCPTGCTCNETFTSTDESVTSCAASSVCHVVATDQPQTTITSCASGSRCDLACKSTGPDVRCGIDSCNGASCGIRVAGAAKLADIKSCAAGAACEVACSAGSTCHVKCDDATSLCRITGCDALGATCTLDCPTGISTDCSSGVHVCGGPEAC